MRWTVAAALVALASPVIAAPTLSGPAASAAAVGDAFHAALHRGDTKGAAILLSDDALIYEAGGVERSKAEYAAHHLPADAEFSKAVHETVTRSSGRSNGAMAWIASEGRYSVSFKGKAFDQLPTGTTVLRRAGSSWKIVRMHGSSKKRAAD